VTGSKIRHGFLPLDSFERGFKDVLETRDFSLFLKNFGLDRAEVNLYYL